MRSRARLRFLVAVGAVTLVSLVAAASSSTAFGSNPPGTLYVSPTGSPTAAGTSCGTATFSHIGAAVAAAPSGGTVVVCPGTYAEDVLINKPLTLLGGNATINATGLENAIQVVASNVSISGFSLIDANGEGLLVGVDSLADAALLPSSGPVLSNVSVNNVKALDDDRGDRTDAAQSDKNPAQQQDAEIGLVGLHTRVLQRLDLVHRRSQTHNSFAMQRTLRVHIAERQRELELRP